MDPNGKAAITIYPNITSNLSTTASYMSMDVGNGEMNGICRAPAKGLAQLTACRWTVDPALSPLTHLTEHRAHLPPTPPPRPSQLSSSLLLTVEYAVTAMVS